MQLVLLKLLCICVIVYEWQNIISNAPRVNAELSIHRPGNTDGVDSHYYAYSNYATILCDNF